MKGLLLDTHVLLWWLADSPRLPRAFRDPIADPEMPCFVSAASIWEIGIKRSIGKLQAPSELVEILASSVQTPSGPSFVAAGSPRTSPKENS